MFSFASISVKASINFLWFSGDIFTLGLGAYPIGSLRYRYHRSSNCSFSIHKVGNLSQEFIETENSTSPAQLVNVPFAVVDEPPVFPGCEHLEMAEEQKNCFRYTIAAYVSNSISREATLLYTQPEGYNVTVVFRIDTEGKIANVRARATSPKLDAQDKAVLEAEAILVVNSIPQMTPGKHNDQVVGVDYAIRL